MEQVINALGGMLLRAVPTFLLVLVLYIFLKKVFFDPLGLMMTRRYEATEGALKAAREALASAEARTAEFEHAMNDAKANIYQIHEHEQQQLLEERAEQVKEARAESERRLQAARAELQREVEAAQARLAEDTNSLAEAISDTILKGPSGAGR